MSVFIETNRNPFDLIRRRGNRFDFENLLTNVFSALWESGLWSEQTPEPASGSRTKRRGSSSLIPQKDDNGFKVTLNVRNYTPEDLAVKVVDKYVTITGKHVEDLGEDGFSSRQFSTKYRIPDGVGVDLIRSSLGSDGILTVEAPLEVPQIPVIEKTIPISLTSTPENLVTDEQEAQKKDEK